MNGSAFNSSSSASTYFWAECEQHGKFKGTSAGLQILLISYALEFPTGTPLNFWLMLHILRNRSKVAGVLPADFFPLHLSIVQLPFCLMLPLFVANHFLWRESHLMNFSAVLCSMILSMKPLLLCLICVERYMAVVRPLDYLRYKGAQYRWGCLGVSWLIYIMMTSITVANYSSGAVCVVFLPVLAIDTFCSLSVLKTLRKPPPGDRTMVQEKKKKKKKKGDTEEVDKRKADSTQGREVKEERVMKEKRSMTRGKGEKNSIKRKAFITIAIIQVVLTFNYVPFIISWAMELFLPIHIVKCQYLPIAMAAACSCSYVQPLLYLHKLGKLPCMASQKPPNQHLHH